MGCNMSAILQRARGMAVSCQRWCATGERCGAVCRIQRTRSRRLELRRWLLVRLYVTPALLGRGTCWKDL